MHLHGPFSFADINSDLVSEISEDTESEIPGGEL